MKRFRKQNLIFIFVFVLLFISIGYAYLTSNLNINGTSSIAIARWDIHFENIQINEDSVTLLDEDTAPYINPSNNTEVIFEVSLDKPGDFYEFFVDVKNDGTINGMIESLNASLQIGNGEPVDIIAHPDALPDYLNYSITYSDDREILPNHNLSAGRKETYKVFVEYKKDIDASLLPEDNQSIHFTMSTNNVQADNNSIPIDHYSPFITELDVESSINVIGDFDFDYDACIAYATNDNEIGSTYAEDYCDGEEIDYCVDDNCVYRLIDDDYDLMIAKGIIIERYMKLASYDIDYDACFDFFTDNGYSEEDAVLLCQGEETADGETIESYVEEGYGLYYLDLGILINPTYVDVVPDVVIIGYDENYSKDVVVPSIIHNKKVVGIADEALYDKGLTSVVIPNTVKYIGSRAFYGNDLEKVEIKGHEVAIGECAFGRATKIRNHNLPSTYHCPTDASCFSTNNMDQNITGYSDSCEKDVEIPNYIYFESSVQTIDYSAFYGKNLTSIIVPSGVYKIGPLAFANNSLEKVTLLSTNIEIKACAFGDIRDIDEHNISNYNCGYGCGGDATASDAALTLINKANNNSDGLYKDPYCDYRYAGSDPNNYVLFNGEVWRIVGVFSTKKSENENNEMRIKLVRNEPLTNDTYGNFGSPLSLKLSDFVNGKIIGGVAFESNSKSLIDDAEWYNDKLDSSYSSLEKSYRDERNRSDRVIYKKMWLLNPSDYGFASNNCISDFRSVEYSNLGIKCLENNWLANNNDYWFSNMGDKNTYSIAWYLSDNYLLSNTIFGDSKNVLPSVYLKADVKIKSGNGTENNPYIFEDDNGHDSSIPAYVSLLELMNSICSTEECATGTPTAEGLYINSSHALHYAGRDPQNYLYFNCDDYDNPSSDTCELWRIIGTSANGLFKIIRKDALGYFSWDIDNNGVSGKGINQWGPTVKYGDNNGYAGADLMLELNGDYLNYNLTEDKMWACYGCTSYSIFNHTKVLNKDTQELIADDALWISHFISTLDITPREAFSLETAGDTCEVSSSLGCRYFNGVDEFDYVIRSSQSHGKVGLMTISDFGYASSACKEKKLSYFSASECINSNWLAVDGGHMLTVYKGLSSDIITISDNGIGLCNSESVAAVQPVVQISGYLKVKGKGTIYEPYYIVFPES